MHERTTPLPPVDLADPIYTVEHVAATFRRGTRSTRSLIARPDFPAAFRLSEGRNAQLYWRRERVLDFVDGDSARVCPNCAAAGADKPAGASAIAASTVGPVAAAPSAAATSATYVVSEDAALAAIAAARAAREAAA